MMPSLIVLLILPLWPTFQLRPSLYQRYACFVPEQLKSAFEAAVVERVKRIRMGDPQHDDTNFGPMVSFAHMDKVLSYIASGKEQGAKVLIGGQRATQAALKDGAFVEPTVFTDCTDDMKIVQEEIFGPVMSILTYATIEEAVQRANSTVLVWQQVWSLRIFPWHIALFTNWKPVFAGLIRGENPQPKCQSVVIKNRA